MCDYSMAHVPNRLATEGEELVVHRFAGTLGLAPVHSSWKQVLLPSRLPAVCVPPGARLRLWDITRHLQQRLGVGAIEEVTFVQLSAEAYVYRDAVRFANGRELLLQRLQCGQRADVLSLGGAEEGITPWGEQPARREVLIG